MSKRKKLLKSVGLKEEKIRGVAQPPKTFFFEPPEKEEEIDTKRVPMAFSIASLVLSILTIILAGSCKS